MPNNIHSENRFAVKSIRTQTAGDVVEKMRSYMGIRNYNTITGLNNHIRQEGISDEAKRTLIKEIAKYASVPPELLTLTSRDAKRILYTCFGFQVTSVTKQSNEEDHRYTFHLGDDRLSLMYSWIEGPENDIDDVINNIDTSSILCYVRDLAESGTLNMDTINALSKYLILVLAIISE